MRRRFGVLLVAVAVSAGTAGVAVGWRANQPEEVKFCLTYGALPDPGRQVEVDGIIMVLVRRDDPELKGQSWGCNHYVVPGPQRGTPLVTPDCRVHYDNDWEGPRINKLVKALANGWCG